MRHPTIILRTATCAHCRGDGLHLPQCPYTPLRRLSLPWFVVSLGVAWAVIRGLVALVGGW